MENRIRIKSHCRLLNFPFDIGAMVVMYDIPLVIHKQDSQKIEIGG
jgi:hypothetical protein